MGLGGLADDITDAELEQSMRDATQGDAENDKFFLRLLFRLCRLRNCSKNLYNPSNFKIDLYVCLTFIPN